MKKIKSFFCGFQKGMTEFGYNISIIINSILLTIVYLFGVGITSLFAKILKKKFLELKIDKGKNTYWTDLDLKKKDTKDYYRQF